MVGDLLSHPQIAVAVGGPTNDATLRAYEAIADRAGIVELRIDLFTEKPDLARLIGARPCPLVVTCRASAEGGSFRGTEPERLDMLREAASLGAELIDVERFAFPQLGSVSPTRVIVSQHDFTSMPANLPMRWADIRALGADVVKVAGMALDAADLIPVLDVLSHAYVPTIAMAMGPAGVASRVVALRYSQTVLTYASLDGDAGTAPGQVSLSEMDDVYRASTITGATRVFGLVGPSSPTDLIRTYNDLLREERADAVCVPLPTSQPSLSLLRALVTLGFSGFHIHGPGQESLHLELVSEGLDVGTSGDMNSLVSNQGSLIGSHVASPTDQVKTWLSKVA